MWEPIVRAFDLPFEGSVVLLPPAMMRFADSPWTGYGFNEPVHYSGHFARQGAGEG